VNSLLGRYFAAVIGVGFVAVWISVGITAAVLCLFGSAVFSFGSAVAQSAPATGRSYGRTRADSRSTPRQHCRGSTKGDSPRTPTRAERTTACRGGALRSPLRRIALDVLFPWRREREPRDPGQLISEEVGWESLPPAVL
jgi:hypothetical protein